MTPIRIQFEMIDDQIAAANRTARILAAAGVRCQHPDWDEDQIKAEVIRRVCDGTG